MESARRSYFDLYAHTARDLKSVNPQLRVGGPATAAASWISEFLKYTAQNMFLSIRSTHSYADDTVEDLFGTTENIPMTSGFVARWPRFGRRLKLHPRLTCPCFSRSGMCRDERCARYSVCRFGTRQYDSPVRCTADLMSFGRSPMCLKKADRLPMCLADVWVARKRRHQ